jgi:hypothetical protein
MVFTLADLLTPLLAANPFLTFLQHRRLEATARKKKNRPIRVRLARSVTHQAADLGIIARHVACRECVSGGEGVLRRANSQGCQAQRPSGRSAHQVADHQPRNCKGFRFRNSLDVARARRRGDRVKDARDAMVPRPAHCKALLRAMGNAMSRRLKSQ